MVSKFTIKPTFQWTLAATYSSSRIGNSQFDCYGQSAGPFRLAWAATVASGTVAENLSGLGLLTLALEILDQFATAGTMKAIRG